jgi:hypothetical protein
MMFNPSTSSKRWPVKVVRAGPLGEAMAEADAVGALASFSGSPPSKTICSLGFVILA